MNFDATKFTWDQASRLGVARDSADGGLVIHDPGAHRGRYARHLDRELDIHLAAIGARLSPVTEVHLIAEAVSRYSKWLDDAPRLREQRLAEERAQSERAEIARIQIEKRDAEHRANQKRLHSEALNRLGPQLQTLGLRSRDHSTAVATILRLDLEKFVASLTAGRPVAVEVHEQLRDVGLAVVSARGYEIALVDNPAELNKALGAAASWRAAGRPLRALRVLDPFTGSAMSDADLARALTVVSAALADIGELELARVCAKRAQQHAVRPEFAENVLARIASIEGRFGEAFIRFANAASLTHSGEGASRAFRRKKAMLLKGYEHYLASDRWAEIRASALSVSNQCEACDSIQELEVHHRTYDRLGAELLTDLAVLCRECHRKVHDWRTAYVAKCDALLRDGEGR